MKAHTSSEVVEEPGVLHSVVVAKVLEVEVQEFFYATHVSD
jgi:hypothetical protein